MPQSKNFSNVTTNGSADTINNHALNPQEQEALASQRLATFMADTSPTSISSNTCGQTTMEKSTSYMAEKIEDFDRMFGGRAPQVVRSEE